MTSYDDDTNVSGNDLPDIVTMAMARRALRGLVPGAPPAASEQLAVVLREGLAPPARGTGWRRLTGRLASLGLAAKITLAAGVAVASAGGAATAVAFTHESSHHGDHPDSPRNHPALVVPTSAAGSQADDRPEHGGHPATGATQEPERHGGVDDGTSGGDGSSSGHDGSGSGSDDTTSGSHDGGSGSGSGSHDGTSGSGSGSGSTSGSGDSTSGSNDGGGSGTTSGGSSGGTSDGGTSGH